MPEHETSEQDSSEPESSGHGSSEHGSSEHESLYRRQFSTPRQERAFLAALGFTTAFGACRGITHSIRAGIGPFHNISEGGTHIHHSTFGIFGLIGIGYLWTYRIGVGLRNEWASRITASLFGIAAALTLDEFALWLDLHDDYWDKQGRKSIDAVALFGGLLGIGVAGRDALNELGLLPKGVSDLVRADKRRRVAKYRAAVGAAAAAARSGNLSPQGAITASSPK